jgi:sn-glycerol 3-phosphate transport system substrate-binding protein
MTASRSPRTGIEAPSGGRPPRRAVAAAVRRLPRRRVGWLLGVPLLALALLAAACGGSDSGSGKDSGGSTDATSVVKAADCPVKQLDSATTPTTITVWHAYVGLQKQLLEQLATDFNASQKKVVVKVEAQGTYEELLKKYKDALANPSSLPDMILSEDTTTQFMIDSGAIVPAASCLAADPSAKATYDDILPSVTASYTVNGVLWPGGFSVSTPVLFTNKALLQQAGLDTSAIPQTLDQLHDVSAQIKAKVPSVTAPLSFKDDSWFIEHWLTGAGKPIVNNDNGRSALATKSKMDQPDTLTIGNWLKGMVDDGLIKAEPSSTTGVNEYLAIATKTSAMLMQTSAAITTVAGLLGGNIKPSDVGEEAGIDTQNLSTEGIDIEVSPVPGLTAASAGKGQIGGSAWYLVKNQDRLGVPAAWKFLQYFLETPNQVQWTLKGSYLPVRASAKDDPTLQAAFKATKGGQWLQTAYEGLSKLNPKFPGPVIGPYNEYRTAYRAAVDSIALNGADPKSALATANSKFQAALDQYKKDVSG